MGGLGVPEDGDHVAQRGDAHVCQVLFIQVQQHVLLDAVVREGDGVVSGFSYRDAGFREKLDPVGSACHRS